MVTGYQKEDGGGSLAVAPWAPTVTPWSLQIPHPGLEAVGMEAAWGAARDGPQFHLPCQWISPSLRHTCEAKGQGGVGVGVAEPGI